MNRPISAAIRGHNSPRNFDILNHSCGVTSNNLRIISVPPPRISSVARNLNVTI